MWVQALLTVFTLISVLTGISSTNAVSLQRSGRDAWLNVTDEGDGGPIVEVSHARRGNLSMPLETKEVEPRSLNLDREFGKSLSSDAKGAELANSTEAWTHFPTDGKHIPTTDEQETNNIMMIHEELEPSSDERQTYNDQEVMIEEEDELTTEKPETPHIVIWEELETTTVTSTTKPKTSEQLVRADAEVPSIKKMLSVIRVTCGIFQELDTSFKKGLNIILEQMSLSFQNKQTMKQFLSLSETDSKLGAKQRNTLESSPQRNIMKYRIIKNMYIEHTKKLYNMYKSLIGSTGLKVNRHIHLKGENDNANDAIVDTLMHIAIKFQTILMELDKTMRALGGRTSPFYKTHDSASQLVTETFSKKQNEVITDPDYLEKYVKKSYEKYNIINTTEVLRGLFQQHALNKMLIHGVNSVISSTEDLLSSETASDDAPQILRHQENKTEEIDSKKNSFPPKGAGNMATRFVKYVVETFKTFFNWLLGWNNIEDVKGTLRTPSITPSENVTETG